MSYCFQLLHNKIILLTLANTHTHTFLQLVQGGDLAYAVDAEDEADTMRQVDVVGERACQVLQQRIEGAEALICHGVDDATEVAVTIAVEADFLGLLLVGERLQRACTVEAAVRAVRRTWQAVLLRLPAARLVPLVKVSEIQLHSYSLTLGSVEFWVTEKRGKQNMHSESSIIFSITLCPAVSL